MRIWSGCNTYIISGLFHSHPSFSLYFYLRYDLHQSHFLMLTLHIFILLFICPREPISGISTYMRQLPHSNFDDCWAVWRMGLWMKPASFSQRRVSRTWLMCAGVLPMEAWSPHTLHTWLVSISGTSAVGDMKLWCSLKTERDAKARYLGETWRTTVN